MTELGRKAADSAIDLTQEASASAVLIDQVARLTAEMSASEDRFQATVMTSTDGVLIVDDNGRVRFANPAAAQLLGFVGIDALIGHDLGLPVGDDVVELDLVRGGRARVTEMRTAATYWAGRPCRLAMLRDMTDRRDAEQALLESQQRYLLVAEASGDGIFDFDLTSGTTYYSARLCELLGRSRDELPDDFTGWLAWLHPEDHAAARDCVLTLLSGLTDRTEAQLRIASGEGGERTVLWRAGALHDDNGAVVRVAGAVMDVTRQVMAEDRLRELSLRDELTGLPNRRAIMETLQAALAASERTPGTGTALLFIDLDGFKRINDTLGHAVGDLVLVETGRRLEHAVRPYDVVGRLGGDEFTVVLSQVQGPQDVQVAADRVLTALNQPWECAGTAVPLQASIGATISQEGDTPDLLLSRSDHAMYRAKKVGGNQVRSDD